MTGWVRPAAVAGRFYPDDAASLRRAVDDLMRAVEVAAAPDPSHLPPKAIVAPHAGYEFSGPVAASAYATLLPLRGAVKRVIVAGPAHTWPVGGVAVSTADAFDTPLGPVEIDDAARRAALEVPGVVEDDRPHVSEHGLEVQLPFLKAVLGDVSIVPLVVGRSGAHELHGVLETLWDGSSTRIVITTDLSHYHDAERARVLDSRTAAAICRLDVPGSDMACGAAAVAGLLVAARQRNLDVELLDLRNSGDTYGNPDRVVGYGAFAVSEPIGVAARVPSR